MNVIGGCSVGSKKMKEHIWGRVLSYRSLHQLPFTLNVTCVDVAKEVHDLSSKYKFTALQSKSVHRVCTKLNFERQK